MVIPRSVAISRSACQNGSSRLMLALVPGQHHGSFQGGAGHHLAQCGAPRGRTVCPKDTTHVPLARKDVVTAHAKSGRNSEGTS